MCAIRSNLKVICESLRLSYLSTLSASSEAFQTTAAKFGSVDILVNSAGILNEKEWENQVDINLVSYLQSPNITLIPVLILERNHKWYNTCFGNLLT